MKYANISVLALLIVLIAAGAFTDGGVVFFMLLPLGLLFLAFLLPLENIRLDQSFPMEAKYSRLGFSSPIVVGSPWPG